MRTFRRFLFIFFFIQNIDAQVETSNPPISKVDFSYTIGYQHVRMNNFNRYYLDTFAKPHDLFTQNVHHTFSRNFQLGYHFSRYFGIGMMVKSDLYKMTHVTPAYITDNLGEITDSVELTLQLSFRRAAIGLFTEFNLGEYLNVKSKQSYFENWQASVIGGASFDLYDIAFSSKSLISNPSDLFYAPCIGGFTQLKLNYPIVKRKSTQVQLGIHIGYQFSKTKTLRVNSSGEWIVNNKYPINADFSGMNVGLGLTIKLTDHKYSAREMHLSKNALYLDILGQSTFGSLVFERILNVESTTIQRAISFGFMRINRFPKDDLGVVSIPFAYNTYIDFNRTKNSPSKLELGFGITALAITKYNYETYHKNQHLYPSLRIGYCYRSYHSGLLFKATLTPLLPGLSRSNYNFINNQAITFG
ncbi:MAG: hypothetical protein RL233_1928, partial [Bacteroidota bacterium]